MLQVTTLMPKPEDPVNKMELVDGRPDEEEKPKISKAYAKKLAKKNKKKGDAAAGAQAEGEQPAAEGQAQAAEGENAPVEEEKKEEIP